MVHVSVLQRNINNNTVGTSRVLSADDTTRLNQWKDISYTPDQWRSKINNFDGGKNSTIKLHCAYRDSIVLGNSRSHIFTGNSDDYIDMTSAGGNFDVHHRNDGTGTAGDSIKYFTITSADVRQKIGQDTNIPVISNQREYTSYLNKICQRLFKNRHPGEEMPVYFYTAIVYIAWFEGDKEVIDEIDNDDLLDHMKAIKIGETGSLCHFYRKMKKLHRHRCGAGDLHCVAYGIPIGWWGHNSKYLESVLHFKFVLANLRGEWHEPGPVRSCIHRVMYRLGLFGIRRGRIVDTRRRRDLRIPPIGVRQREAGIVNDRGSIYMVKIVYPQRWITEMKRVYNVIVSSNLSDDMKRKSLNYITTFLYHCKVGAVRGNLRDFELDRLKDYYWAAPYKFEYILMSGFRQVFHAEHRFGDFLSSPEYGLWILGEYFTFSSIELMKKALCKFINTQYPAVGQANGGPMGIQINDITVHGSERDRSERGYTVYNINLSTIEELIERGIITAGFVKDYMTGNVYQVTSLQRDREVNF